MPPLFTKLNKKSSLLFTITKPLNPSNLNDYFYGILFVLSSEILAPEILKIYYNVCSRIQHVNQTLIKTQL